MRYFCIKTGSGDFIPSPLPPRQDKPSVHIRPPRGRSLCEKLESSSTFTPEIHVLEKVSHRTTHLLWPIASRDLSQRHQEGNDVASKRNPLILFLSGVSALNWTWVAIAAVPAEKKSTKTSKLCHASFRYYTITSEKTSFRSNVICSHTTWLPQCV